MDIVAMTSDAVQLVIPHQYGRRVGGPSMKGDLAFVVLVFKILIGRTEGKERPPSASIFERTFVEEDGVKQ
jgi:hypothetical protein